VDFLKWNEFNRGFLKANLNGWVNTAKMSFYMPVDSTRNEKDRNGAPTLGKFPGNQKVTNSFVEMSRDLNAIASDKKGKKLDDDFVVNNYVATKGVFHVPAEHKVDGLRHAVEFQIYFDPWTMDPKAKKAKVSVNPGKDKATSKTANAEKGSMSYVKPQAAVGILFKVRDCQTENPDDKEALGLCEQDVKPSDDLFKALDVRSRLSSANSKPNVYNTPLATFMASIK